MAVFDLGDVANLTVTVKNSAGAAANAGSVACTVTQPDGTATVVAVSNTGTGTYSAGFTPTQAGRHLIRWVATGANASSYTDVFDAFPANPRFLISLNDLREALNLAATNTTHDAELRLYLAAATAVIETIDRSYLAQTRTHTFDGGRNVLVLPETPITSVTSITHSPAPGTTQILDTDSYRADEYSGVIYHYWGRFPWGKRNITVTYTVGDTVVPPNVILAARELCRHWWQRSQQSPRPAFGGAAGDSDTIYIANYAVPNFVIGLLQPSDGIV